MLEKVQEWDEQWSLRINGHKFGRVINTIFVYFTHIGSVIPWIVVSILLFMFKQDELAVIQFSAVITFGLVNFIIKRFIRRKRPYKNEKIKDRIELRDFLLRNGGSSFPSGHVTTFTLQTLLLAHLIHPYFIFFTIFGLMFVGYSRLYNGCHYPTDVFGGIAFGIGLRFLIVLLIPTILGIYAKFLLLF